MKPEDPAPVEEALYECPDCGTRTTELDGRLCDCGGEFHNISVPRPQ